PSPSRPARACGSPSPRPRRRRTRRTRSTCSACATARASAWLESPSPFPFSSRRSRERTTMKTLLVATAAALSLAFAGSALAAYTPHLSITHTPLTLAGGGTTDLTVAVDQADDATAKVTIYVPQGYTGTLGASAGSQLGTLDARQRAAAPVERLRASGPERELRLDGADHAVHRQHRHAQPGRHRAGARLRPAPGAAQPEGEGEEEDGHALGRAPAQPRRARGR